MDEFGRQLDVVAKDLLVLSDAVDVSYPANQVAVDDWSQFTVTELTEKPKNERTINACQSTPVNQHLSGSCLSHVYKSSKKCGTTCELTTEHHEVPGFLFESQ